MSIKCELHSPSMQAHLQQVYTGFFLLARSGRIELLQRIRRPAPGSPTPPHLRDARNSRLLVVVNDKIRVCYDTHDSWEPDEEYLRNVDFYFKRSYSPGRLRALGESALKVHPLGLNYALYPDGLDRLGLQRAIALSSGVWRVFEIARALKVSDPFKFTPRVNIMSAPPDPEAPPAILFMVRAFETDPSPELTPDKIEERHEINRMRADCVDTLRSEFGGRFYGGFVHTDYAVRNYREQLAPDRSRGSKGGYIELLRSFPICIATTGIHGSIGWKFAEYIAFAKAMVSEPLNYEVPGDLAQGRNYLRFDTPDQCVTQARRLMDDDGLRRTMMENNARYYERYLRPDMMVWNTLAAVMAGRTTPSEGRGAG